MVVGTENREVALLAFGGAPAIGAALASRALVVTRHASPNVGEGDPDGFVAGSCNSRGGRRELASSRARRGGACHRGSGSRLSERGMRSRGGEGGRSKWGEDIKGGRLGSRWRRKAACTRLGHSCRHSRWGSQSRCTGGSSAGRRGSIGCGGRCSSADWKSWCRRKRLGTGMGSRAQFKGRLGARLELRLLSVFHVCVGWEVREGAASSAAGVAGGHVGVGFSTRLSAGLEGRLLAEDSVKGGNDWGRWSRSG